VQVGLDSRRVLKMKDIPQFSENTATIGNGAGAGSAQNIREYHVERPVHVNPTHDIYRERMPAIFYVNTLYPHFYADSMAAHHSETDRNVREDLHLAAAASAPFNQGCHFPQHYGTACLLPTIVPTVEPEAYMQQHYGGDQNIGTCWFRPGIRLESGQGSSSSFMEGYSGNETATTTRQRSSLKELALLPGCKVSSVNDESDQEQEPTPAIVEDAVCIGAWSGVGRPEAQRPPATARRGGSGFQSAQNLSLSLFQPHPAVGQVPLVIPDLVKLRAPKKEKEIVVELGLAVSSNEAINLAGASSRHQVSTRVASSTPTLAAQKVGGPSPPKSDSRMAANLSAGGDTQRTALKNSRFMKPIMDILQEFCHLTMVQQTRKRPGHPPVRQTGVRLIVEGEVYEPVDLRLGPNRPAPPGKATRNLPVPLRLDTASVIEIEAEKQYLLKMLEEVKTFTQPQDELDVICFIIRGMHFQMNSAWESLRIH
jgi:hypothetical protein